MNNIGFIGLGLMGKPMARRLLEAGQTVAAHSRRGVPGDLVALGARSEPHAKAVAEAAEVIFLMLPDTPDVEKVLFGSNGVVEGLSPGKVVVDMSSISPAATKEFARRIEAKTCFYIDAPVSGGTVGAENGTLTIMVGGREDVFARVLPLFEHMGKTITLVGGNGDGQTAKVANQIIVAMNIQAVAEALVFASKAGADPSRVRAALMGGFAGSRVLEVHGERMLKRSFAPGFRVELHQKDLAIALDNARALKMALPGAALAQQLLSATAALGGSEWDDSALVCAIENMAGHRLGEE